MPDETMFALSDFLPYLLNQAAEAVGQDFSTTYKDRYGMLRTEWRVLAHLGQFGPLTATQIGQRAQVHKTRISRAVAALQAKRFVTRQEVEADRRSAVLNLTRAGRAAYDDLARIALAHNRKLIEALGGEAAGALTASLRKLAGGRV